MSPHHACTSAETVPYPAIWPHGKYANPAPRGLIRRFKSLFNWPTKRPGPPPKKAANGHGSRQRFFRNAKTTFVRHGPKGKHLGYSTNSLPIFRPQYKRPCFHQQTTLQSPQQSPQQSTPPAPQKAQNKGDE